LVRLCEGSRDKDIERALAIASGVSGVVLLYGGSSLVSNANRRITRLREMKQNLQVGVFFRRSNRAVGVGLAFVF